MEGEKIIYTKRFPKIPIEEWMEESSDEFIEKFDTDNQTGTEFIENLMKNTTYELVESRMKNKDVFIEKVKRLSLDYEIDADIAEHISSINVRLYIDIALYSGYVKSLFTEIITMADELSFLPADDCRILLTLEYYTHQRYVNGIPKRELN